MVSASGRATQMFAMNTAVSVLMAGTMNGWGWIEGFCNSGGNDWFFYDVFDQSLIVAVIVFG